MAAAVAFFAGTALQIYGQYKANQDQAVAEERNAAYYDEQANHAKDAMVREANVYQQESEDAIANQTTSFAKAGVDMSGSALLTIIDSKSRQMNEFSAIRKEGEIRVSLARMRAEDSRRNAFHLTDPNTALMQGGGTFLTGAGQFANSRRSGGESYSSGEG